MTRLLRRAILAAAFRRFQLALYAFVHVLNDLDFLLDIKPAAIQTQLTLALLDVLADIAPLVLVVLQTIWEPGALQVGQDTGHDSVDGAESRDGGVRARGGADGCQGGRDHDLDAQTSIYEDAEETIALRGGSFGVDDSCIDADVRGRADELVQCREGGHAVDAGQGAEDEEFVVRRNQRAGFSG